MYHYAIATIGKAKDRTASQPGEKPMSDPILFGFPRSTFVQIVRMVLTHKNVSYTFRDLEPEMGKPTHLALHPFNRVPILQHGDFTVYETIAIVSYVEDTFDSVALRPPSPRERARMDQCISAVNSYYYPYMIYHVSHERRVFPELGIASDEKVVACSGPSVTAQRKSPRLGSEAEALQQHCSPQFRIPGASLARMHDTTTRRCSMKWITRERVKVDRVACPWLIKKFVDKDAEFVFVPADKVMQEAKRLDAIPYDVKNVELGHHGKECSFEAILKKYGLTSDPALVLLGKIVNGADTDNTLYHQPEGPGLEAIAEGFRHLGYKDDHALNAAEWIVYDAL
jgi:glutathione S-transferase